MGVMTPKPVELDELSAGEVGFFVATIKNVADTKVGDTITEVDRPCAEALPGFEDIKTMVFAGLYTVDSHEHAMLRDALEKLRLNDASFSFEPESSVALGFGFRCGFLGLLHLEIIQERLEREYNLDLITTAPGVRYKITLTDGAVIEVDNPSRWPDPTEIETIEEPVIIAKILTNEEYVGGILKLVEDKRGRQKNIEYVSDTRVMLTYELPLNEIVLDFYDRLKTVSRGYASLDYHLAGTWISPMVKMDILIGGDPVDALSIIVHRDFAYDRGTRPRLQDARTHPAPDVRSRHPGRHRLQDHRPRNRHRHPQKRHRQVLRRRHQPQAQAARQAERRQEAHEAHRQSRHPPGSLPRRPQGRRRLSSRDRDKFRIRNRFGNGQTVFFKPGDMQGDAFDDEAMCLVPSVTNYSQPGQIGHISSPTPVVRSLVDHCIFAHGLLQPCLLQNTLACAFRYILPRLAGDRDSAGLYRMFILTVASCRLNQRASHRLQCVESNLYTSSRSTVWQKRNGSTSQPIRSGM